MLTTLVIAILLIVSPPAPAANDTTAPATAASDAPSAAPTPVEPLCI
jgi:hypothetical protein